MPKISSLEIHLASRPNGILTVDNFALARAELKPLPDQQVLVRNLFMSVEPYTCRLKGDSPPGGNGSR